MGRTTAANKCRLMMSELSLLCKVLVETGNPHQYQVIMQPQPTLEHITPQDEPISHPLPTKPPKRPISPSTFRKPCDLCHEPNDVLVRCQIDETTTWHLVCPKRCWRTVSGGVVDGSLDHPHYEYGGMWKNKHALVSAKKPKHKKKKKKGDSGEVEQGAS